MRPYGAHANLQRTYAIRMRADGSAERLGEGLKGEETAIGDGCRSGDATGPPCQPYHIRQSRRRDDRASTDQPGHDPTPASRGMLAAEACSCL